MSLLSTTTVTTLALGAAGAFIAAGAALGGPVPAAPAVQQPSIVVARPSALPCPRGTLERQDECLRVIVAPSEPNAVPPVQVRRPAPAPAVGSVAAAADVQAVGVAGTSSDLGPASGGGEDSGHVGEDSHDG